jgi:hypothetical protein
MESATWTAGPEYEGPHFGKLGQALRDLGYALSPESYGVAGSQEIRRWRAVGPGGDLIAEAETYMGLTLTGPKELVADVRERVLGAAAI